MSIKENVPVNRFIVVDSNSVDNTVDVIKTVFPDSRIITSSEPLAQARKLAISYVETEWFAFIDSDVKLCKDWFKILSKLRAEDVGTVQGTDQYANKSLIRYSKWQKNVWRKNFVHEPFMHLSVIDLDSFKKGQFRGLTHNTLIRTSSVIDWNPPLGLNVGEDHHLFLHIIHKGYKWVVVNDPVCLHYAFLSFAENIRRGLKESQEVKKLLNCGYIAKNELWIDATVSNYLKMFVLSSMKGLLAAIYERDPKILLYKTSFFGSMLLSNFVNSNNAFC